MVFYFFVGSKHGSTTSQSLSHRYSNVLRPGLLDRREAPTQDLGEEANEGRRRELYRAVDKECGIQRMSCDLCLRPLRRP